MNYFRHAEQRLALVLEFSWNFKHLEFSIWAGIRIWLWILHTKECWKCSRKCHGQLFQQQEKAKWEKLNAVSDNINGGSGHKPDIRRRTSWPKWLLSGWSLWERDCGFKMFTIWIHFINLSWIRVLAVRKQPPSNQYIFVQPSLRSSDSASSSSTTICQLSLNIFLNARAAYYDEPGPCLTFTEQLHYFKCLTREDLSKEELGPTPTFAEH